MKLSLEDRERLIHEATLARTRAYAPYSRYQVGAAILTEDGQLFSGGNVENAVYPLGLCAERVAIAAAVTLCLVLEQTALFRPREEAP